MVETYGELNASRNNAILICHALSGDHHAAGYHSATDSKPGWWDSAIGPGKAIDTTKFFVVALNNLAYLYLQQNKLEDALQYAEKAVKQRPDNAAAVDTYAQVLVAKKDYKKAVQQYDAVVNDDMQNEEIYLNYVEALFLDGSNLLAKRKLERREMKSEENIARQAQLKAKYAD